MICKECGAYNPDHATYCKVCAANLKGEPAAEKHDAPEEDTQPTKRFSRPSWVAPEQVVKAPDPIDEEKEEPEVIEEVNDVVEEPEPEAPVAEEIPEAAEEPEPEDEAEETEETLWTPSPARKPAKRSAPVHDEDEDEEEPDDEDEVPYCTGHGYWMYLPRHRLPGGCPWSR